MQPRSSRGAAKLRIWPFLPRLGLLHVPVRTLEASQSNYSLGLRTSQAMAGHAQSHLLDGISAFKSRNRKAKRTGHPSPHRRQVTMSRFLVQLRSIGVDVSKRQLVRLLIAGQDRFVYEARDVLRSGLCSAPLRIAQQTTAFSRIAAVCDIRR